VSENSRVHVEFDEYGEIVDYTLDPPAEGAEWDGVLTSSRPRPDLVPGHSKTTSSLVPYPVGDELVGDLVPPPRPESLWKRVDIIAASAHPPTPPEVAELFYRGKLHVVSGEFESGKTWLLLAAAARELREGRGVVWINADRMTAAEIYERLHSLGVSDEAIDLRFYLVEPDTMLEQVEVAALLGFIEDSGARLVVGDALNSLLAIHAAKATASDEVEGFLRRWHPFAAAGCAVVFPDHVVKAKEERGSYAYGSERKITGTQVHLGLMAFPKIRRGEGGKVKIAVYRDRGGFLHQNPPGVFVLEFDDGAWRWWLERDVSHSEDGFRPTNLMEKVSRYVEGLAYDPPPRSQIEQNVEGKGEYVRKAIDCLIEEGYAAELAGQRGARLVESHRPYREGDE
jgi:AAA domain